MRKPANVRGYCRVSSSAQSEHGTSLEGQRDEITRYCQQNDLPAPRIYVEVESGGSEKIERRVELARIIADSKAGDLIVVCKADRWSRDIVGSVRSVRELVARGVGWRSIGDGIDATTQQGDSVLGIMAWVADQERIRIRERTVVRRQQLRALGKFVEGEPPFGYRVVREERTLVVDEEQAEILREMFRRCVDGESTRTISNALMRAHPKMGGLDHAAIARKLASRQAMGEMRPSAKKNVRAKPGDPWIQAFQPIVDRVTWLRAQEAIKGRRLNGRPVGSTSRTAHFLLRGFVTCHECGTKLGAHHPGENGSVKHGGYYICRNRTDGKRRQKPCPAGPIVPYAVVDAEIDALCLKRLGVVVERLKTMPDVVVKRPDFESRRASLVRRRDNYVLAIGDGTITHQQAREQLDIIADKLVALEQEEAQLEAEKAQVRPRRRKEALAEMGALAKSWGRMEPHAKREAMQQLVESASIDSRKRLIVRWKKLT